MTEFLVRCTSGECSAGEIDDTEAPPESKSIKIENSVGLHAVNQPSDVSTIQDALNRVPPEDGGPVPALKVDGICGPKTRHAIQKFQLKQFGWKGADSRIDPNKQTIAKLNELASPPAARPPHKVPLVNPDDPNVLANFKELMTFDLKLSQSWIKAAQFEITKALPFADSKEESGPFRRSRLMERLNLHFAIDILPTRRETLWKLRNVYDNMAAVFQRPGGLWGERAFALYRGKVNKNDDALAFTWYGGFYHPGQEIFHAYGSVRQDTIYIIPSMELVTELPFARARMIVHELAHFVGGHTISDGFGIMHMGTPILPRCES